MGCWGVVWVVKRVEGCWKDAQGEGCSWEGLLRGRDAQRGVFGMLRGRDAGGMLGMQCLGCLGCLGLQDTGGILERGNLGVRMQEGFSGVGVQGWY